MYDKELFLSKNIFKDSEVKSRTLKNLNELQAGLNKKELRLLLDKTLLLATNSYIVDHGLLLVCSLCSSFLNPCL